MSFCQELLEVWKVFAAVGHIVQGLLESLDLFHLCDRELKWRPALPEAGLPEAELHAISVLRRCFGGCSPIGGILNG